MTPHTTYFDAVKKTAEELGLPQEIVGDSIGNAVDILKEEDPRAFLKIMRVVHARLRSEKCKLDLKNGTPINPLQENQIRSVAENAKDHIFEQLVDRWQMHSLAAQCAPDLALAHAAIQMLVDMNDGGDNWLSYLEETLLDLSNQKRSDNHTKNLTDSLKST